MSTIIFFLCYLRFWKESNNWWFEQSSVWHVDFAVVCFMATLHGNVSLAGLLTRGLKLPRMRTHGATAEIQTQKAYLLYSFG